MALIFPYFPAGQSTGIATWADGTDEEIAAMIAAADAGQINLLDYWSLGDERTVSLDAMTVGDAFTTAMAAQDVVLVLMDTGAASGYVDVDDKTVNFVVGQKDCLSQKGRINTTNTIEGSWNGCAMRTDLHNKYYNALPATFRACLKQFKTITALKSNGRATIQTSEDYIALFAEKEIFGSRTYSDSIEADALTQIDYYKTESNRIKQVESSAYNTWWTRSPLLTNNSSFSNVARNGTVGQHSASNTNGIAPFMCI